MTMLAKNGQIAPYLKRLADASELAKAQAVALFAENLGLEPSKIGSLVSTLKQQVKDTQSQDSEQGMEGENFED